MDRRSPAAAVDERPLTADRHAHVVQFYEDDEFLYDTVADHLAGALDRRQPALVIATEQHRDGFVGRLMLRGIDVDRACAQGWLTLLDARETLATFMDADSGLPDGERFRAELKAALDAGRRVNARANVCAYGEMVDVLWGEGNRDGAIRLEALWNELADTHAFSLLCAYALRNFASATDADGFADVCRHHTEVRPTERFLGVDERERLAEISRLQQQAAALSAEVAYRRELEAKLRDALAEREELLARERTARAAAETANRAKGDFLAIMSHELRTPLNAMVGYAELLELGVHGPVSGTQREILGRIQRSQRHLLGQIDEVLTYARSEAGKDSYDITDVPLDELLRAAELELRPQMRDCGLSFSYESCDETLAARADRRRVQQILLNLLTNAAKYTPQGGSVRITCTADDDVVCVGVHDTGPGIPLDKQESVFEPFYQLDTTFTRDTEGLGLGLAIGRRLARAMDGDVRIASEPGAGSTFTLILPRATA